MRQIKYEAVHEDRLSRCPFIDSRLMKRIFEENCLIVSKSNPIQGFIHELGCDPFGYVLMSDLQVNLKKC